MWDKPLYFDSAAVTFSAETFLWILWLLVHPTRMKIFYIFTLHGPQDTWGHSWSDVNNINSSCFCCNNTKMGCLKHRRVLIFRWLSVKHKVFSHISSRLFNVPGYVLLMGSVCFYSAQVEQAVTWSWDFIKLPHFSQKQHWTTLRSVIIQLRSAFFFDLFGESEVISCRN